MASKRRVRAKACRGKHAYPTPGDAIAAARRLMNGTVAYACNFCGQYHLGHNPRSVGRRIAERRGQ